MCNQENDRKEVMIMPARLTKDEFIKRARAKHGDKYDYSQVVYKNNTTPVTIICPIHGPFKQTPHNHLHGKKGRGCPYCASTRPNTTETFIKKAIAVHGNKYDYSKVKFTRNKDKVTIICPIHGPFQQEANSHLQGHGCPKCKADHMTGQKHPERGKKIQKTIFKKYGTASSMQNPGVVNLGQATKIKNGTYHASKPENKMYDLLAKRFGKEGVIRQYKDVDLYPFLCDFFIVSRRMFIELNVNWTHGGHWYDPTNKDDIERMFLWANKGKASYLSAIKTWTIRDVVKRHYAMNSQLNYLTFWHKDLSDFKEWLANDAPDGHDYNYMYSWKKKF